MGAISAAQADPARQPRRTAASSRARRWPPAAASAAGQATGPGTAIGPGGATGAGVAIAPGAAEWGWRAGPVWLFALGSAFVFGLGFGLAPALGSVSRGWRLRGRLGVLRFRFLGLLGGLIALDQFLRHALRHAGRSLREHWLAFARQPFLGVEKIRIHDGGRIEAFTSRKQDAERQRQGG